MRSATDVAFQLAEQEQPTQQNGPAALLPPASPTRRRAVKPQLLPLWQRLCRAAAPDAQAYLQGLGPLTPTAWPSVLQPLVQRRGGTHAPSSLARTRLAADGTHLAYLLVDGAGQLLPVQGGVAQCHLELGTVKGVLPSGEAFLGPALNQ